MNDTLKIPVANPNRRAFLKKSALSAMLGGAFVACSKGTGAAAVAASPSADSDQSGGSMAAHPVTPTAVSAADEMDRMHEAGIKAFPAKTAGKGNQLLEPKIVGGVKVFELTARKIQWETSPGIHVEAYAYNDQVPGPQIRVREGDRVKVILKNELPESTVIHFHGLELPNAQDGVPFITQPPVKSGASYAYEIHGAEFRLAHVPLTPQLDQAGWTRPPRRLHRRAEGATGCRTGRCRSRDGAQ